MSRRSISTPCPAPSRASSQRISALPSFLDDDTSQIEYTRVIQHEFAHARPRRPGKRDAGQKVFEDVVEGEEIKNFDRKQDVGARGTLLGKRPSRRVPMSAIGQGRASMVQTNTAREETGSRITGRERTTQHDNDIRKDSRRRTIYVPPDDTTMMTIHPGANTTNRLDDTFQLPNYQPQSLLDCISQSPPPPEELRQNLRAKKPRMSLAAAPRRAPLGQLEAKSLNSIASDVAGDGGGKENVPPSLGVASKDSLKPIPNKPVEPAKSTTAPSRLFEPTTASQSRQTIQSRKAVPMTKAKVSPRAPVAAKTSRQPPTTTRSVHRSTATRTSTERRSKDSPTTTKAPLPPKPWKKSVNFVSANDVSKAKLQQYPVLNEDVSRPELYEDCWLHQQEVALTEVVNQIFAASLLNTFDKTSEGRSVRERLLNVYDQPHVATLHQRLQASLLYGALSKPKDMPSPPDLTQDLGLRRRFMQLWIDSYRMETLSAAVEVVVGRKIPGPSMEQTQGVDSSAKLIDPKESRRSLIGFLETFLVTVDDLETYNASADDLQLQRRNKTVLRSLMLIWLLDRAVTGHGKPERLFKVKSVHKSSASVLNALASMLMPSIGDMTRVMRHMEYTVSYLQDPLDEVVYRINNLAVDLRDGIMLTKLVELLLYNTPLSVWDGVSADGDTLTIVMPDATVLESALYGNDGVQKDNILMQHVKMPCLGHAQKAYNVDIALQALAGNHRTASAVAANITADTIVNGHRENTLNLLWSLVSSIGLEVLLDKTALINDIARLDPTSSDLSTLSMDTLLQNWAAAYCAPNCLQISNLTTSFANEKPYSAIITAFSDFFAPCDKRASLGTNTATRLRSMGCSEAFVKQLTSSTASIPTRQTTIANLAFLASRLLPLAKRHHAAATIQRAFRAKRGWTVLRQRVALMRMAADCAKVVRTQQKLVDAAVLVQRAWRGIVRDRVQRLEQDVSDFQVIARGWMERRRVAAAKRGMRGGGMRVRW